MDVILALIGTALLLFFLEIFLPGGILAIVGALVLIGASAVTYTEYGLLAAMGVLLGSMIVTVLFFWAEITFLQRSPVGRWLFLTSTQKSDSRPSQASVPDMAGKTGETVTKLVPTGTVLVDGKKYEAWSQTGWVDAGVSVEVVRQETYRLVVRPATRG